MHGPLSYSVTLQQVGKVFQRQKLQLFESFCMLQGKRNIVSMTLGALLSTLQTLCNLCMGSLSQIDTLQYFEKVFQRQKLQLFQSNCELQGKTSIVSTKTGAIFTTLHTLLNMRMGPLSYSVTLQQVGKAFQRQKLQLFESICKVLEKKYCEYDTRGCIINTLYSS